MLAHALLALALGAGAPVDLEVDLREAPRRVIHARLAVPARPGPLVLAYPRWIPGHHRPSGPIADLTGLRFSVGGKPLAWTRDPVDPYAFRMEVPAGADRVEAALDLVGSPLLTTRLATLRWDSVVLYPRGASPAALAVHASLLLPPAWSFGSSLQVESQAPGRVAFAPVSLEELVDSPVLAGRHLKRFPLALPGGPPHAVVVAAETEEGAELPDAWRERLERLLAEAAALFGGHRFRRFEFLLALSDHLDHNGLEHHQSTDIQLPERYLAGKPGESPLTHLFAHEYTHTWNGKYRRPEGLVTPDFQDPQRTADLWIYEGLTQYLGYVLSARSGILGPEELRDAVATMTGLMAQTAGRAWRPLEDTATSVSFLGTAGPAWSSWRRSTADYYMEGVVIWLEVDALLREHSGGKRSLDDFCRTFLGGGGPPLVRPYQVPDVVAALAALAPLDWKAFFAERVAAVAPAPPTRGIERSGWRLGSTGKPGPYFAGREAYRKALDLRGSLGLALGAERWNLLDVVPGSPADRAGVSPGGRIAAVNGRKITREVLAGAIAATPASGRLELLVEDGDFYRAHTLEYRGGARYPVLERDPGRPDLLSAIVAPRAPPAGR